jgi:16S rRNA (uracil1498-N3)-methyltransferase
LEYLSNIELYFCSSVNSEGQILFVEHDEFHHATKVMRNKKGDRLFASDGKGKIFEGIIEDIRKDDLVSKIKKTYEYKDLLSQFTFCVPNLKNPERLKFALEKCTELGITKFILFNSEHTVSRAFNLERLNKIVLSAMKQSLRAYLPKIEVVNTIIEFNSFGCELILFDQSGSTRLSDYKFDQHKNYLMIFGPEGGFYEKEISELNNTSILKLTDNRLRTETATVKAASIIS